MVFQLCMYYLSFSPLWISVLFVEIMSIYHGEKNIFTEIIIIVLIPVLFVIALIRMKKELIPVKVGSVRYKLKEAKERKFVTAEFLATFVIPLFAFDFTTWEGVVLFSLFFLIFGFLCVYHNYLCTNIMLDILRYRTYKCVIVNERDMVFEKNIISKRNLHLLEGTYVFSKGLNNEYYFDCGTEADEEQQDDC